MISDRSVNMGSACISAKDFKRLEKKVDALIEMHSEDTKLTAREKKLVKEVKDDLKHKRYHKFKSLDEI